MPRESSILSRCFSYQEVLLWKPSVKKAVILLFLIASTPKWIPLFQCKLWVSLAWFSHISSSFCINRSCTTWHCHQFLLIVLPACVCEVNCGNYLHFAYLILCSSEISHISFHQMCKPLLKGVNILRHCEVARDMGKAHLYIGQGWTQEFGSMPAAKVVFLL